ncbi:hypothetical protein EPR50_G00028700 [Perca flavescens]|uniref:Uncharacterized protein n=2 Tax=Perca flavescens TaxID=8167 RepID=A0A484DKF6_PERFV|nr:hypothetical protein EPR50_G00028700 [Perca flavescens]
MSGNASQVAMDFGCCTIPKNLDDQIELMQNLADIVMGTVQYNEEGVLMSINELCGVMTNTSKAYEKEMEAYNRLVKLAKIYHSTSDEPCLDISHEKTVKDMMDTSLPLGRRAERQWTYQTCTEFGFCGVDPWKELSVVQDRTEDGEEAQTIFIRDTAHCADMMSRKVTDRCSLKKAREEIEKHVVSWLKMAAAGED